MGIHKILTTIPFSFELNFWLKTKSFCNLSPKLQKLYLKLKSLVIVNYYF